VIWSRWAKEKVAQAIAALSERRGLNQAILSVLGQVFSLCFGPNSYKGFPISISYFLYFQGNQNN
jgi:hypothetical protein